MSKSAPHWSLLNSIHLLLAIQNKEQDTWESVYAQLMEFNQEYKQQFLLKVNTSCNNIKVYQYV